MQPCAIFYLQEDKIVGEIVGEEGNVENLCFPLQQVSLDELALLRESTDAGFVLKKGTSYYYADVSIVRNHRIVLENAPAHLCANCRFLSALPDEEGGCAKVRAFSRKIENFDFITYGYETFGTVSDVFMVHRCLHWQRSNYYPKRRVSQKDKLELASFLFDDVKDYNELRQRIQKISNR